MAKEKVAILDIGSGNLRSALKAFEHVIAEEGLEAEARLTHKPEDVLKADRIVLPGQGAFGDCMTGLNDGGLREALDEAVLAHGRPYLGICVGMQMMVQRGLEHGIHAGLGWIEGQAVPLRPADPALKIPHMGWNTLEIPAPGPQDNRHFVLRSIKNDPESPDHYYFVHSFVVECEYGHHVLAFTEYGGPVTAVIGRDNMAGVQFHPEKSQAAGLRLISDFLHWKP